MYRAHIRNRKEDKRSRLQMWSKSAKPNETIFSKERAKKPNNQQTSLTFGHDVESSRPSSRPHRNLFLFISFSQSIVVVVAIPIVVPFSRFASFSHYFMRVCVYISRGSRSERERERYFLYSASEFVREREREREFFFFRARASSCF